MVLTAGNATAAVVDGQIDFTRLNVRLGGPDVSSSFLIFFILGIFDLSSKF